MKNNRDALERQNAFYETIRAELEAEFFGKWVVICEEKLVGVYDSNPAASEVAIKLASDRACLVKRVGYVFVTSHPFIRLSSAQVQDR